MALAIANHVWTCFCLQSSCRTYPAISPIIHQECMFISPRWYWPVNKVCFHFTTQWAVWPKLNPRLTCKQHLSTVHVNHSICFKTFSARSRSVRSSEMWRSNRSGAWGGGVLGASLIFKSGYKFHGHFTEGWSITRGSGAVLFWRISIMLAKVNDFFQSRTLSLLLLKGWCVLQREHQKSRQLCTFSCWPLRLILILHDIHLTMKRKLCDSL